MEALHRWIVEEGPAALLVVGEDGRVAMANREAVRLLGRDPSGRKFRHLFDSSDRHGAAAYLAAVGRARGPVFFAGDVTQPDGDRRFLHISSMRAGPEATGHRVVVAALVDATEQRERERALAEGSLTDTLTGLPNRALLFDRLNQLCRAGGEGGAVAFVDMDRFKALNDRYGHEVGDRILLEVADRLRRSVADDVTVARVGGDEFVLLFPRATVDDAAVQVRKLLEAVTDPIPSPAEALTLTASAGVAPVDSTMVDLVLRRADAAMYEAKKTGRNQVVVYGPEVAVWAENLWELAATVARLEQDRSRLEQESRTDALTGLANVRALNEAMRALAGQEERRAEPLSVLFIDLDRFGAFNKHRGDARGDVALRRVARTVASVCREGDSAYRKGGEELVILLPRTEHRDAMIVGERVRAAVEALGIPHGGHPGTAILTITVGVATSGAEYAVDEVQAAAADAAYRSKLADRRNRAVSAHD